MSDAHTNLRPASAVIHAGQAPEPVTGAIMPPIVTASTYVQKAPGEHTGFEYTRSHNPTRYALERMIARLEGSQLTEEQDASLGGFAFGSGLAAIAAALELLDAGSNVLVMDDIYGGTNRLFNKVRSRTQAINFTFADLTNPATIEQTMTPDTKLVWVETPTNPTLKLVDLQDLCARVRAINPNVLIACDNTFATPMSQQPLLLGCDIVMHSSTKYLGGHSDVVGGILAVRTPELAQQVRFIQNAVGAIMGPFDAYLTLRGIKTLAVRMDRHTENATKIAKWLEAHPQVEKVIYPGLPSHPQAATFAKQMKLSGGMISAHLKGGVAEARRFLSALSMFALAESLGGVESLVEHPAIMTHASVSPQERAQLGISDNFVRFSVGIEDADDLIADLERGFAAILSST